MRVFVLGLLCAAGVAWAQAPRIYARLDTDMAPQVRSGRVFLPAAAVARQFNGTAAWHQATRTVTITHANQPTIILTIGSTAARVGDRAMTLDAAPFIFQGRTLAPLRFVATALGIPVQYHAPTRSVYLYQADRQYVLPLESLRAGIIIADPQPNALVRTPILVQGQANVFEGALIIEVQDTGGQVLGRTIATAGQGGFYPYSTTVSYNLPSEDPADGRIVVYSQDGEDGSRVLARAVVRVRLASTI